MPTISPDRLLADLHQLRSFGASGNGVVRPSLSPIDMKARHWLADRVTDAGLTAHMDGIGNVFGRSKNAGKALLVGSHSDTQPTGGWLDGALGVIYAIEAARALSEEKETAHLPLDTVAWVDEESTFLSCFGSRAYCSMLADGEMENAANDDGQRLSEALVQAKLDGNFATPEPNRYLGYLEAHIEQGPHLEAMKKRIGVVTAIVGSRNHTVHFTGRQNHAGTTPMHLRSDAGIAMMTFGHQLNEAFKKVAGEKSVWTMGRVQVSPGASSIIPGKADLHLQFRDPDNQLLDTLEAEAKRVVAAVNESGPVSVEMIEHSPPILPADMDSGFQEEITRAAKTHAPENWESMPSAAVHDAMFLSQIMPAGMMFIPSIGGVSHDFSEDTSEADIVLGAQVFASAIAGILSKQFS